MISFVAPLVLTALLALPVIYFLLRVVPPRPQQKKFAPFIFLERLSSDENLSATTPWWLLLLRLLAFALFVIGLAGPTINAVQPSTSQAARLVVVDNSWVNAYVWPDVKSFLLETAAEVDGTQKQVYLLLTTRHSNDDVSFGPLTPEMLVKKASEIEPLAKRPDYAELMAELASLRSTIQEPMEVIWISDGTENLGAADFIKELRSMGDLTVFSETETPRLMLHTSKALDTITVSRMGNETTFDGQVTLFANDGRELDRVDIHLDATENSSTSPIELPLSIQNDVALAKIDGISSAGAVSLSDARNRRALVGLPIASRNEPQSLLSGQLYISRALEPYADFLSGSLTELIEANVSVIILDDVGNIRSGDFEKLTKWVSDGGVLIRFAGPNLANASLSGQVKLLPVDLRSGERAFGGTLTWDTPKEIAAFNPLGPFAELTSPKDALVRRQVLALADGVTANATWASLEDGTPLVTGTKQDKGSIALFHVTSSPEWSDLPLTETFVEMLRALMSLTRIEVVADEVLQDVTFAPLKMLDGFGDLNDPHRDMKPLLLSSEADPAAVKPFAGLYGQPDAAIAVNVIHEDDTLSAFRPSGVTVQSLKPAQPIALKSLFLLVALAAFLLDCLATIRLSGKSRLSFLSFVFAFISVTGTILPTPGIAQPIDNVLDQSTIAATLQTRLAYVETGDAEIDRISALGLNAISRQLARRTAVEPGDAQAINLETDDLAVYPIIYWPISDTGDDPSESALGKIEVYMQQGGLIIFDTRDDEIAFQGATTAPRQKLNRILRNIDVPALSQLDNKHVLLRSFYLLNDLTGRFNRNPVWVESDSSTNDSVTTMIIGGRDWAGAWARDNNGRAVLPMSSGGNRAREMATRGGINMVMVALTGNYKSDQVHTPVLLKRLGR